MANYTAVRLAGGALAGAESASGGLCGREAAGHSEAIQTLKATGQAANEYAEAIKQAMSRFGHAITERPEERS